MIVWFVLLPITIVVWANILTLPHQGPPPKFQGRLPPQPTLEPRQPPIKRYAVCSIAGPCCVAEGPVR
jgi:hypothetical protein